MLSQSICFPACKFCCCWLGKCAIAEAISLTSFIPVKLLKICIFPWDPLLVIWEYTPGSKSLSYPICMQHSMGCHKRVLGVPWNIDHWSPFSLSFSDNGQSRANKPRKCAQGRCEQWTHKTSMEACSIAKNANPLPLGHLHQQPLWVCSPLSCCMFVCFRHTNMIYRPRSGASIRRRQ